MRTRRLPIHGRHGLRAYALVDAEDHSRLAGYRWHLTGKKYGHVARWEPGHLRVYLHHQVLGVVTLLDHVNRNALDNRKENLRRATNAENAQNQDSRGGASRFRGVTWDRSRGKWRAQCVVDGKCHNLGRYDSEEEAGVVASRFRAAHMPFSEDAAPVALAVAA